VTAPNRHQVQHSNTTQRQTLLRLNTQQECLLAPYSLAESPLSLTLASLAAQSGGDAVGAASAASAAVADDGEFWALVASLESTIPTAATTDASAVAPAPAPAGGIVAESPGFLLELDHLLQATAEPTAAPAVDLVPIHLPMPTVRQHIPTVRQHQHQHHAVPSFDDSLLTDPTVTELAAHLLKDKEAFANAERLVQASCHAKAAPARKLGGGAAGAPTRKRKPKQDVPAHKKDAKYWRKRQANTEAARRTRERAKLQKNLRAAAAAQAAAAKAQLNVLIKRSGNATTAY